MKQTLPLLFFSLLLSLSSLGQEPYIPASINSPLFNRPNELQFGATISNYGLNYNMAGYLGNGIAIFSLQHNSGQIKFDPLNFADYEQTNNQVFQEGPTKSLYCEMGYGIDIPLNSQKLNFIAGIGQQMINSNTRIFLQLNWGNESEIIDAGVSIRANYMVGDLKGLLILEPVLHGKLKFGNFRIINQFGYTISTIAGSENMVPIITLGLGYVIPNYKKIRGKS